LKGGVSVWRRDCVTGQIDFTALCLFGVALQRLLCGFLFCFFLIHVSPSLAGDADIWSMQVKSYYGEYDAGQKSKGYASASLARPRLEEWMPPPTMAPGKERNYTIGVSFPHYGYSLWKAVNYGILEEAKRLGIAVRVMEAGGYGMIDRQQEQLRQLAQAGVDGILLGSVSYSGNNDAIAELKKQGIPVVGVVNDVSAPDLAAKALVSFLDMGYYAGEFIALDAERRGLREVRVAAFPGPKKSGWSADSLHGLLEALQEFPGPVRVVETSWGSLDSSKQRDLVRRSLMEHPDVDYVVGNAVAADVAYDILLGIGMAKRTTIVSTYIMPGLYEKIREGQVAAAPSGLMIFQGRMAVDMLIRLLDGDKAGKDFPFRSGPFIPLITTDNIDRFPYEALFGPRDYKPILRLDSGR